MSVPGSVLYNRRTADEGSEQPTSHISCTDCDSYGPRYRKRETINSIQHYAAPGRIDFSQAVASTYTPTSVGQSFGPTWSTHWFRLDIEIPEDWLNEEVRLVWESEAEAMIWKDGIPLQGFANKVIDFIFTRSLKPAERNKTLYIEMACITLFEEQDQGKRIVTPDPGFYFELLRCELVVIDKDVQALIIDLEILNDIFKSLPSGSNRGYQALYTANNIVNEIGIQQDTQTFKRAREMADKFFSQKNGDSQHEIIAVGNYTVDTAWLWPHDETKRKCARIFANVVRLLDDHPEFTFACSQAAQFEWIKLRYPAIYSKMECWIGKGRLIPVGGTWVEMDGYIPSSESLIRQFLIGQRFFQKEFGITCSEFWLSNNFGYSAQLPQIMKLAGIRRFVSQKNTWNLVNKFPHHTFWWKGIDGSTVLTHFPPAESCDMDGTPGELVKAVNNFQDKGRLNCSLFLYGSDDVGPTEETIERLKRLKDCDGLPRVKLSTPSKYFERIEQTEASKLCEWTGEIYLELHNGTYTTKAQLKKYNRKCEILLRDLEAVCTMALVQHSNRSEGFEYPSRDIERMWKLVLQNQSRHVLPGSSMSMTYKEAVERYEDVTNTAQKLIKKFVNIITETSEDDVMGDSVIVNTLDWNRSGVVELGPDHVVLPEDRGVQSQDDGTALALVDANYFGITKLRFEIYESSKVVTAVQKGDDIHMSNGILSAIIDSKGRITKLSLCDDIYFSFNAIEVSRYGNQFVMFYDVPVYYDAKDVKGYHLDQRKKVTAVISTAKIVAIGPVRAAVQVSLKISDSSSIRQTIILDAKSRYLQFDTEVDWNESHRFLKVEFPLSVRSQEVTWEIQSGHVKRSTNCSTSLDWAKFEVCGHKWVDMSEFRYGVALLNDSRYGWSCVGNVLRLSLLRSQHCQAQDDFDDVGTHSFSYAIMPHRGTLQEAGVINAAYELNNPLRVFKMSSSSTFQHHSGAIMLDSCAIIIQAFKKAEDDSNSVVVRLYESYGCHLSTVIMFRFSFKSIKLCNALEQASEMILDNIYDDHSFRLNFKPFEIISLLVKL